MQRVVVFKQALKSARGGGGCRMPEPLVEKNRFMGEIDQGKRDKSLRVYSQSVERLARTVSLNIEEAGDIEVHNGTKYAVKNSAGDLIRVEMLSCAEITRFVQLLKDIFGYRVYLR